MKLRKIILTTLASGSLFLLALADEQDHLKNFEKNVEAVKGDMAAALGFIDSTINVKIADLVKLDKELQDFQATVDLAVKQKKQVMLELAKALVPFESRILVIAPDKKALFDKIKNMN